MALLFEGFESALMACSLIVILPGLAAVLSAGRSVVPALAAYAVAVAALSWLRFSDRGGGVGPALIALALGLATVLLVGPVLAGRRPSTARVDVPVIGGGFMAGVAAAELWRPCVGFEFGQVVNGLPGRGPSGFALMAVYLAGVLSPLIGVVAIHQLLPDRIRERIEPWSLAIGGTALGLLALATAAGLHDELVGKLFEWSVEA